LTKLITKFGGLTKEIDSSNIKETDIPVYLGGLDELKKRA
jgi:hypothetical protein